MNKYFSHLLKNIPHKPGVYRMKNAQGDIIYIGKAKDLFKRVGSYFKNPDRQSTKTVKMVENIADIDYTVTSSELEALILETNLIKENRPKYNVLMKDDKNYAYIKITTAEDYPRIMVVRNIYNDKARYFGPKTNATQIRDTLNMLRKIFPFRTCNLEIKDIGDAPAEDINKKRIVKVTKAGIKYPCLDLHIKRCLAPCVGKPGKEEYREMINKIIELLEGKVSDIIKQLKEQMHEAAVNKKFELAAKSRDKLLAIENIYQNQLVSSPDRQHTDIINFYPRDEKSYFNIFQIREGKLIDQQNLIIKMPPLENNTSQILEGFLQQFYLGNPNIPKEILVPAELEHHQVLENWLSAAAGYHVKISTAKKGKKDRLLDLSLENAFSFAKQSRTKWEGEQSENREEGLEKLGQLLGLTKFPQRIECYDISHLGGTHTVASMVVFENGYPKTEHYRHFKISLENPGAPDDFFSIKEVIFRRLKYLKPSPASNGITIKKHKDGFQIRNGNGNIILFKTLADSKLKVLIAPFKIPSRLHIEIIMKIVDKFNTKRVYLQISKKNLGNMEKMGFQKVKIKMPEYENKTSSLIVVYDKTRNFKDSSFCKRPDLIVIDGGKGQLAYAVKALEDFKMTIPIISLAKREEEIFSPGTNTPILLEAHNPTRLLIQHLRDEAHRFAIEYNRKLRKKDYTTSELENLPGIGKKTTQQLLKNYGSLENIKGLPVETLAKVIGTKTALKIKSFFN